LETGRATWALSSFCRSEIRPQPYSELLFVELAGCKPQHGRHDLSLERFDLESVQPKEDRHRHEGDALVAVAEGVTPGQSVAIGGREAGHISRRLIGEALLRAC
jgi:hypothetical protein